MMIFYTDDGDEHKVEFGLLKVDSLRQSIWLAGDTGTGEKADLICNDSQ